MQDDIKLPPPSKGSALPPAAAPPHTEPSEQSLDRQLAPDDYRFGRRKIAIIAAACLVVGVALLATWAWFQLQPPNLAGRSIRVAIASGASLSQIADQLKREGIIKNALVFKVYAQTTGSAPSFKSGTYVFSPAQDVPTIVRLLENGKVNPLRITIPPGQTTAEIKARLIKYGYSETAVTAALAASYNHPLLASKPPEQGLEGYIFPDTYEVPGDGQVKSVLSLTFDTLYQKLNQNGLQQALAAQGLNIHQALTLASIIQMEDKRPEEQKKIAQVFLKRLKEGMPLGSDVTFIYAARQMNVTPTPDLISPYNTRINKGLPPGPIGNFNMSALEAVAYPVAGDFLYFVAGDNGVNYFARTLEEHQRNVAAYCLKLCQ